MLIIGFILMGHRLNNNLQDLIMASTFYYLDNIIKMITIGEIPIH
jgi:hypothetical protein